VTSTTDKAGHPDVAEISDLTEGLLSPSRIAGIRQHLDECDLCADVYASLEEIRGLLGTLPGPPRMPDDVAGRIDAALAAEALLNATAPNAVDVPAPVGSSSRSLSDADDSAHVSRETSATADRPAGRARTATTGPGRKDRKRSGRRKVAVLGAVFGVAALGFGSVFLSSLNDGKSSSPSAQGQQSASADTFSEGKLNNQVADLLAKSKSSESVSSAPHSLGVEGNTGKPSADTPKILKQPTVPACVQQGIGRDDPALATQEGTYKGTAVLLVVLPDASDSTRVTAYIVDMACVDHPSSGTGKVLLKHSYSRS
jgi:anti-sigma factor RsiW